MVVKDWIETAAICNHHIHTVTPLTRTSALHLLQQRGRGAEVHEAANDPAATPVDDDDMTLQDVSDGEDQ